MISSAGVKLVVFDLAGTTIEDSGHVVAAFRSALDAHGIQVSDEQIAAVRGASKRQAIGRLIPQGPRQHEHADAAYAAFRDHLRAAVRTHGVREVGGAQSVFRELRALGIHVALNTGFERDVTELLLAAVGWNRDLIDAVECGDDVREGRPAPFLIFRAMEAAGVHNVRQVANVGDTALDLSAGFNAGVRWNIAVLTGAHRREALSQAPHTHLVDSVADVPALLAAATASFASRPI